MGQPHPSTLSRCPPPSSRQITVLAFATVQREAVSAYVAGLPDRDLGRLASAFGLAATKADLAGRLGGALDSLAAAAALLALLTLGAVAAALAYEWALRHDVHRSGSGGGRGPRVAPELQSA